MCVCVWVLFFLSTEQTFAVIVVCNHLILFEIVFHRFLSNFRTKQSNQTTDNCFSLHFFSHSRSQSTIDDVHRCVFFSIFNFCHPLSDFLLAIVVVVVAVFLLAALVRCRRSGSDVIYVNCLRDISIENPYYEPVRTPLRINCNTPLCYEQQQQSEWWSDKELPRRLRSISFHDGHNQAKLREYSTGSYPKHF